MTVFFLLVPTLCVGTQLCLQGLPRRAWEPGDDGVFLLVPTLCLGMQLCQQELPAERGSQVKCSAQQCCLKRHPLTLTFRPGSLLHG